MHPVEGGTRVYHREALVFRRPFRWVLEPLLRRWLARDTPAEVNRMATLLLASLRLDTRTTRWGVEL